MSVRRTRLPPLNSLKAFEAVARTRSIKYAAMELAVSPQAISQQIKLLEEVLNVALFVRKGRTIEPTEVATTLARFVTAGFDEFQEGIRQIHNRNMMNRITLNVTPYFATRYLLPRLERFRKSVPNSDIRLTTMVEVPDFGRDDIDVGVQWGYGDWELYETTLLLKDHKVICCNSEIGKRIADPRDLLRETLLQPVVRNTMWSDILRYLGLPEAHDMREMAFDDAATMRRATLSGMGIGLISRIDAISDIQSGHLIAPFGIGLLDDMPEKNIPGFYLVLPKSHYRVAQINEFCKWIENEDWYEVL